jgi:hypothetical protein
MFYRISANVYSGGGIKICTRYRGRVALTGTEHGFSEGVLWARDDIEIGFDSGGGESDRGGCVTQGKILSSGGGITIERLNTGWEKYWPAWLRNVDGVGVVIGGLIRAKDTIYLKTASSDYTGCIDGVVECIGDNQLKLKICEKANLNFTKNAIFRCMGTSTDYNYENAALLIYGGTSGELNLGRSLLHAKGTVMVGKMEYGGHAARRLRAEEALLRSSEGDVYIVNAKEVPSLNACLHAKGIVCLSTQSDGNNHFYGAIFAGRVGHPNGYIRHYKTIEYDEATAKRVNEGP